MGNVIRDLTTILASSILVCVPTSCNIGNKTSVYNPPNIPSNNLPVKTNAAPYVPLPEKEKIEERREQIRPRHKPIERHQIYQVAKFEFISYYNV